MDEPILLPGSWKPEEAHLFQGAPAKQALRSALEFQILSPLSRQVYYFFTQLYYTTLGDEKDFVPKDFYFTDLMSLL